MTFRWRYFVHELQQYVEDSATYLASNPTHQITERHIDTANPAGISGTYIPDNSFLYMRVDGNLYTVSISGSDLIITPSGGSAVIVGSGSYLPLSGGVMVGDLVLDHDPIQNLEAVTKQYVDNVVSSGNIAATIDIQEDGSEVVSEVNTINYTHALDIINSGNNTATVLVDESELNTVVFLDGNQTISGNKTFTGDAVFNNITVTGNQTILNVEVMEVEDNIVVFNSTFTGSPTLDAGIEIERGDEDNAQLIWDETNDYWTAGVSGALERVLLESDLTSISEYAEDYSDATVATYSGYAESEFVNIDGDTMTGFLNLSADPTSSGHAANKNYVDVNDAATLASAESYADSVVSTYSGYVDTAVETYSGYAESEFVNIDGDTMTGFLNLSADPTELLHAATKQYVDNETLIITSGLGRTEYTLVHSVEDFPTPSGGIIYLEEGNSYEINGIINIGTNTIEASPDSLIIGLNSLEDRIIYTGSGSAIQCNSGFVKLSNFAIEAENGTACSYSGTNQLEDILEITNVRFRNCDNLGDFKDVYFLTVRSCIIKDDDLHLMSDGFSLGSNISYFRFGENLIICPYSDYSVIDLAEGLTISGLAISNTNFVIYPELNPTILVASGVTPAERGVIIGNTFAIPSFPISGGCYSDPGCIHWEVFSNAGIEDTVSKATYNLDESTTTDITAISTPVKISGNTTAIGEYSRFEHSNNRLIYIGLDTDSVKLMSSISVIPLKNNIDVNIYVAKNGVVLEETKNILRTKSASEQYSTTVLALLSKLETGDYLELWIENDSTDDDIIVDTMSVVVLG